MTTSLQTQSQAQKALRDSSHPALRQLTVEETPDTLVITGSVSSYYLKQLAQETLKAIGGPREVVNHVKVVH